MTTQSAAALIELAAILPDDLQPTVLQIPTILGNPDWLAAALPFLSPARRQWAGFHTFRHTVASRLFAGGRNIKQVQRWLGHHSPSFTLDTYVHLLDDDLGAPLAPLRVKKNQAKVRKQPQTTHRQMSLKWPIIRANAKKPQTAGTPKTGS